MTTNRLHKTLRVMTATAVCLVSLGIGGTATALDGRASDVPVGTRTMLTTATAADDVTVEMSPSASSLAADGSMTLTITVENSGETDLEAGTLAVESGSVAITSRTALSEWLDGGGKTTSDRPIVSLAVPALGAGLRHTAVPIVVTADLLDLPDEAGAYPVDATYTSADTVVSIHETLVFAPDVTAQPLGSPSLPRSPLPRRRTVCSTPKRSACTPRRPASSPARLDGLIDRPVALGHRSDAYCVDSCPRHSGSGIRDQLARAPQRCRQ